MNIHCSFALLYHIDKYSSRMKFSIVFLILWFFYIREVFYKINAIKMSSPPIIKINCFYNFIMS